MNGNTPIVRPQSVEDLFFFLCRTETLRQHFRGTARHSEPPDRSHSPSPPNPNLESQSSNSISSSFCICQQLRRSLDICKNPNVNTFAPNYLPSVAEPLLGPAHLRLCDPSPPNGLGHEPITILPALTGHDDHPYEPQSRRPPIYRPSHSSSIAFLSSLRVALFAPVSFQGCFACLGFGNGGYITWPFWLSFSPLSQSFRHSATNTYSLSIITVLFTAFAAVAP